MPRSEPTRRSVAPSPFTLVTIGLEAGVWHGRLSTGDPGAGAPDLTLTLDGAPLPAPEVTALPGTAGAWSVRAVLPADCLREGVCVFVIGDAATGTVLARLPVLAGTDLAEDLRGEVALLRAELDQLRAAFQDMMRPPAAPD